MLARRSIEGKRVRTQEQVYVIYSALINHVKFPRRPLRLLIKPRFDLIVLKDKGGDAVDHKRAVCLSTLYASLCSYSAPVHEVTGRTRISPSPSAPSPLASS